MTSKKELVEIQDEILKMLKDKLPAELSYHSYEHTLDVLHAAERIAKSENVSDEDMAILKTAAVFHDTGYIYSREDHEQRSCMLATEVLSSHGIDKSKIEKVNELILATIYPQNPKSKLGEIICDADLDYLGRDDYFKISQRVFEEFKFFGIVHDEVEWKNMQVKFLESHKYFTKSAIASRKMKKEENLRKIKESI